MRASVLVVAVALLTVFSIAPVAAGVETITPVAVSLDHPDFSRYLPSAPVLAVMRANGQLDDISGSDEPIPQPRSGLSSPAHSSADPPWSANKRIDDDTGAGAQNEVSLAVDTNGNWYSGWNDARPATTVYKCSYTGSQDGGATWSANYQYIGTRLPYCGDPVIASDTKGNLYRLAMPFTTSPGYDGDLDVSKSTDGGVTWGNWVTAISGNGSGLTDKPWIAADGDYVAVTYTWFGGGEIRFLRSLDGGVTWGGWKDFGSGQGTCVTISSTGRTHMGWGTSTVQHHFSDDKGASWSAKRQIGDGGTGGGSPRSTPLPGCAVSPDGQHVYWVWAGRTTGSSEDVWIAHSGDSGVTWSAQKMVNDDTTNARQVMPWVAVDSANKVHVAWMDWRNGNPEAFYSSSTDNGATWSANTRISDGTGAQTSFQGDYDQIAVAPSGEVGFTWCDTRNSGNEGDIYFSKAPLGSGGGSIAWINVTPPTANITADQTQQFAAAAFDAMGNQTNATFTWGATGGGVSATGLYTPGPAGTFTVYANASGKTGSATITVIPGALSSVAVTPTPVTVPAGQTRQFAAAGKDAKGNTIPITATWAAQRGGVSATGLYTAPTTTGADTVTATDSGSGKSGTAAVTVIAGAVTRLDVTPPTAAITADQTQQFVGQGFDQYNNPAPVTPTWSVSGGGGAISPAGLYTPSLVGTYTVTGSANGTSDTAQVTVTPGALSSIVVTPAAASITADETAPFTAKGLDAKGNEVTIAPAWAASPSGSVSGSGLFTPDKVGVISVKASQGAVSGTAQATVRSGKAVSVAVDPATATITADETAQFTASALDAKGNEVTGGAFDWSAAEGTVASGKYTPAKTGTWDVTATFRGTAVAGKAQVTVTPGRVFDARVTPATATVKVDETFKFKAVALDQKGNEIPDAVPTWTVPDKLGKIDSNGVYTATRAGETEVVATYRVGALEVSDSAKVTVTALDAVESMAKLFGGTTNLMLFFVLLAALIGGLIAAGLMKRRKRKARAEQTYGSGSEFGTPAPYPTLAPPTAPDASPPPPPGPGSVPTGPPPPYIPPPPQY